MLKTKNCLILTLFFALMKNKKWLLILIIIFPSGFWVLLELSTINSKRLPYFGPKELSGKDTIFYKVNDKFYTLPSLTSEQTGLQKFEVTPEKYPAFVLLIMNEKYKREGYRLEGFLDYVQYNFEHLVNVPVFVVGACDYNAPTDSTGDNCPRYEYLFDLKKNKSIYNLSWPKKSLDSLTITYFLKKPSYVDYSFFVLIDKNRNIRGYYDTRYAAEVKRMLGEYKHLRLKEEKENIINENEIKDKNHE